MERLTPPATTLNTLDSLALAPRWPVAKTRALEGRCRVSVLGDWATNLDRRVGSGAAAHVREMLLTEGLDLPSDARPDAWIAVGTQLRLTELIVDLHQGGDLRALHGAIVDDVMRGVGRAASLAIRTFGPRRLIEQIPRVHAAAYDCGRVDVDVASEAATLRYHGAGVCAHPTWRLLQAIALALVFELTRKTGVIECAATHDDGLTLRATW